MSNICGNHSCSVYIKPALRTKNGREAYMLLFDHFLGPNNVGNMEPFTMVKRSDSTGKHTSGSTLNSIQSSMD
jgi:hypothetical protein